MQVITTPGRQVFNNPSVDLSTLLIPAKPATSVVRAVTPVRSSSVGSTTSPFELLVAKQVGPSSATGPATPAESATACSSNRETLPLNSTPPRVLKPKTAAADEVASTILLVQPLTISPRPLAPFRLPGSEFASTGTPVTPAVGQVPAAGKSASGNPPAIDAAAVNPNPLSVMSSLGNVTIGIAPVVTSTDDAAQQAVLLAGASVTAPPIGGVADQSPKILPIEVPGKGSIRLATGTLNPGLRLNEIAADVKSRLALSIFNPAAGLAGTEVQKAATSVEVAAVAFTPYSASLPAAKERGSDDGEGVSSAILPEASPFRVVNGDVPPPVSTQLATAIRQHLDEETTAGPLTVRIRLNASDLGPVNLHISIVNDVVSIRIVAHDQQALQMIDSQMHDLWQSLSSSGVSCGQFQVACDSGDQRSSYRGEPLLPASNPRSAATSSTRWARQTPSNSPAMPTRGALNCVA
jgi:hypothetical protein